MNRIAMPMVFVALLATVGLAGCTVQGRTRATVEPVSTVEVTSAPVIEYWHYPSTFYRGRTVYWIGNRWGYPSGDRWVYYRTEPPPLARHRTTIDRAPPAPRTYVRPAPPAVRPAPPAVRPAPPAVRQVPPSTSAPPARDGGRLRAPHHPPAVRTR